MRRPAFAAAFGRSTTILRGTRCRTTVKGSAAPTSFDGDTSLPEVLGFYTLSMALLEGAEAAKVLAKKLPRYPMPVALIGRLAVDERAHGRRLGETLLIDASSMLPRSLGVLESSSTRRTREQSASIPNTTS
jgi:hypothetical protein